MCVVIDPTILRLLRLINTLTHILTYLLTYLLTYYVKTESLWMKENINISNAKC